MYVRLQPVQSIESGQGAQGSIYSLFILRLFSLSSAEGDCMVSKLPPSLLPPLFRIGSCKGAAFVWIPAAGHSLLLRILQDMHVCSGGVGR